MQNKFMKDLRFLPARCFYKVIIFNLFLSIIKSPREKMKLLENFFALFKTKYDLTRTE